MGNKVIRWIGGPKSPARYLVRWSEAGSPLWTFEVRKAQVFTEEDAGKAHRKVVDSGFSKAEVVER